MAPGMNLGTGPGSNVNISININANFAPQHHPKEANYYNYKPTGGGAPLYYDPNYHVA